MYGMQYRAQFEDLFVGPFAEAKKFCEDKEAYLKQVCLCVFCMENQTVLSQRTALLFTCLLYSSCRPQIGSPWLSPHPRCVYMEHEVGVLDGSHRHC